MIPCLKRKKKNSKCRVTLIADLARDDWEITLLIAKPPTDAELKDMWSVKVIWNKRKTVYDPKSIFFPAR